MRLLTRELHIRRKRTAARFGEGRRVHRRPRVLDLGVRCPVYRNGICGAFHEAGAGRGNHNVNWDTRGLNNA